MLVASPWFFHLLRASAQLRPLSLLQEPRVTTIGDDDYCPLLSSSGVTNSCDYFCYLNQTFLWRTELWNRVWNPFRPIARSESITLRQIKASCSCDVRIKGTELHQAFLFVMNYWSTCRCWCLGTADRSRRDCGWCPVIYIRIFGRLLILRRRPVFEVNILHNEGIATILLFTFVCDSPSVGFPVY